MSRPFEIYEPPELAYHRRVLFAIEVIDSVTLERVAQRPLGTPKGLKELSRRATQGLTVAAVGLKGTPVVNAGGLFVWLHEDTSALQKVTIKTLFDSATGGLSQDGWPLGADPQKATKSRGAIMLKGTRARA